MSDPKQPPNDGESFFRKVVRFVANPTTDWADLTKGELETRESEYAKSELKAMIERKRRNDFVRKREFDMLRKIRREGLTSEGLSVLAGLSNLDDSEARQADNNARTDGVKAKIDEIEQQMVGESASYAAARRTAPAPLTNAAAPAMTESFFNAPTVPLALGQEGEARARAAAIRANRSSAAPARTPPPPPRAPAPAPVPMQAAAPPPQTHRPVVNLTNPFAVEVNELAHDPELDEAVIAFANADFEQCERTVRGLISPGGNRQQHAETWLVLFDLYRAIGQQQSFESLALDYVHQFGWSPPQWFSLPKLVADSAASSNERKGGGSSSAGSARADGAVSWASPESIDADAVARLRSQLLQMPMPWVLDWSAVRQIDPEACHDLRQLLQTWAREPLEMRWLAGDQLLGLLAELAPTGTRDVDPEYWLLRLEACRLANRPDQFDEVAIDYCMTYEVSPPSWESARCTVRMGSSTGATAAQLSHVSEVSTGFVESEIDGGGAMVAAELAGQLVGDISGLLKSLEQKLGTASMVNVSCAKLIRIDFIAAGDLLNWVLARRSENRAVNFDDANRLVALFCGAMGINEHARVKVRNI